MAKQPQKSRSAVTNGTRLFVGPTPSGPWGRRFRDLVALALAERGGAEALGIAEQTAVRQWAATAVRLEQLQEALARGEPVDSEELGQLGDRMDRQARAMGKRKAAPRAPTILEQRKARLSKGGAE